jgi:hypothetical protein
MLDPWQGDFPRGDLPGVMDALRSIHWKLDDRRISMELYKFAGFQLWKGVSATGVQVSSDLEFSASKVRLTSSIGDSMLTISLVFLYITRGRFTRSVSSITATPDLTSR